MSNKKKHMDVLFIKLDKIEPPIIKEDKSNEYVKFGKDNNYPDKMIELNKKASLHRSIINKKVRKIVAQGLLSESEQTETFIREMSKTDMPFEFLEKTAKDLEIQNGFYWEITWAKNGKKINRINHLPYEKCRLGKRNEDGVIDKVFYKEEGIKKNTRASDMDEYPVFDPDTTGKKEPQILYALRYEAGQDYYPLPSYNGAVIDIDTAYQISTYHNANIKNGFAPSYVLFFRGTEPEPDEKNKIVKKMKEKYSGAEQAGQPVVFFLDTGQEEPILKVIESSDNDKQFEVLNKDTKETIVNAHEIPRQVVGLESAGSLGNTKEILQATALFQKDYIENEQDYILRHLNALLSVNNLEEAYIKNPAMSILMFDIKIEDIFTTEELRQFFGLEKKEAIDEQ